MKDLTFKFGDSWTATDHVETVRLIYKLYEPLHVISNNVAFWQV